MTQLTKDKKLQSSFLASVVGLCMTLIAFGAEAQVRLENTIKKVQTYVDESGEVKRRMVDATSVVPGDELQYVVKFVNEGAVPVDAGTIVITDAIPEHTVYLDGTAFGSGTDIKFSLDGKAFAAAQELLVQATDENVPAKASDYSAIRWTFGPALKPGESSYVSFNVRLK